MNKEKSTGKISTITVKWGIGIAITLILALSTTLQATAAASTKRDIAVKVLESKVAVLEKESVKIAASAATMVNTINEMKEAQASFQGTVLSELSYLKEGFKNR